MATEETFLYTIKGPGGKVDAIEVTVDATPNDATGQGESYTVESIKGDIGKHAITGMVGEGGDVQKADGSYFDNAIFLNTDGGIDGSKDGIDAYGLEFQADGVDYNFSYDAKLNEFAISTEGKDTKANEVHVVYTDAPCFCPGTLVGTDDGDVAVETLAIGDLVRTTEGELKAIRWIGRRAVATRFADPLTAMPVRIKAGAISPNTPSRDLLLSPCHAVEIDGVLIHAGALVNGVTIVRESDMDETFTYYHVELGDHSLILAEGLASETFIDNVDRMAFDNWQEHEALYAGNAPLAEMDLPRAKSQRQVPYAVRAMLSARAYARTGIDTVAVAA